MLGVARGSWPGVARGGWSGVAKYTLVIVEKSLCGMDAMSIGKLVHVK